MPESLGRLAIEPTFFFAVAQGETLKPLRERGPTALDPQAPPTLVKMRQLSATAVDPPAVEPTF